MNEKSVGISQQTLVSNNGNETVPAKRLLQYIATLSSTIGAVAAGMILSWTSAAGADGIRLSSEYNIKISPSEFSWIGSISALAAGLTCVPIGILADIIGRKYSMLLTVVPFTIGWLLIIFANSVLMFIIGRFIVGIGCGAFCVAVPMYVAEIAENEIRGRLGSYFQLLLTIGILLTYSLGSVVNIRILSIISAIVPFIFLSTFVLMPDSPVYYLKKGNEDSLVSVCIFIVMFSMGFGPLPWMMMGEIFAPEVKSVAASSACFLNWFLAFIVTKFYDDLKTAMNIGPTFFLFSAITFIGIFFVYILVLNSVLFILKMKDVSKFYMQ